MSNYKNGWLFFILSVIAVILFMADILLGSIDISIAQIFQIFSGNIPADDPAAIIILQSRLPKAITSILAGCALPVAGLIMQTFFRNPVAGPDILGVSAGSSLFVALVMLTVGTWFSISIFNSMGIIIAAITGSFAVLFLILFVSTRVRDNVTLLIFGLMFGMAISAVVGVLQYYSSQGALKLFVLWSFGSLSGVTWSQLTILIPVITGILLLTIFQSRVLNMLLLGEQYAVSMGLNIRRSKFILILITGVLTGAITAFCGPIAFVGIAVPHLSRMLFRVNDHLILIPGSMLLGICILLLCDIISQTPGNQGILPINAITAFMGAPFIIYIIWKNQHLKNQF